MKQEVQYEAFLRLETGSHTGGVRQLLVSQDGKTLITSGEDKTIRLWDVETRKQTNMLLGEIGSGLDGKIQAIALSKDEKYLVALVWRTPMGTVADEDRDSDLCVYELETGNLQASFRLPGTFQDLDFSPDNKYLAIVGNPKPSADEYRVGFLYIYDTQTVLKPSHKMSSALTQDILYEGGLLPSYVRFVPDPEGKNKSYKLVAAAWEDYSYDGKLTWYSYDAKNLKKLRQCETENQIQSLAVSQEYVIVTGEQARFFCHDHQGQQVIFPLEAVPAQPAFSRDGSQLIMGQKEDSSLIQVKVYNTSFGQFQLKSTYYGHDSKARAVAFLQDGTAVSAGGDQNAIHFWSTAHLEGEQMAMIKGIGRVVHGVGINDDQQIGIGNHKELINQDSTITLQRMFDLPSMSLKWIPVSDNQSFHRALPALEDRSLGRSGGGDLLLFTPDQPEGLQIRDYEWYDAITFGFTPKGFVIVGAHDGKVRRITLNKARTDRTGPDRYLEGHATRVLDHAASSKWLVTAGTDQIIRLWFMEDVEKNVTTTLQPALNLFVGTDDEWVIWSKSGYYNASRKGDSRFGYHVNRGADKEAIFIPGHRFIKSFFRPDIIDAIVEQGSEEQAFKELRKQDVKVSKVNVAKILPPILEMEQNGILLAQARDQVTFKFTIESLDSRNPVKRVWVVVNDRDVTDIPSKDWKRESPQSMKISIKISLPLQAGPNHFKILAQNKTTSSIPFLKDIDGPEVSEASVAARGTAEAAGPQPGIDLGDQSQLPVNGTLYLLAIGVSDLKWEKGGYESLKYADEDAISIYNAFAKSRFVEILDEKGAMKNGAFKSIEPCILLNKEATQEAILDAIKKITDQIQKHHQANPAQRDVLFVFLSGHGVRSYDEAELYFWNYDLDFDDIGNTGLSFIELGKKMTSLPADIILATDACKSGMAGSNVVKGIDPNELAKQIYAINERGMYILSATRSGRNAIEANSLKHGIFTMTILNKLREVQPGGSVNMLGLIDYVQMGVHKYTQNLKNDYQTAVCRIYGDLLPLMIYKME